MDIRDEIRAYLRHNDMPIHRFAEWLKISNPAVRKWLEGGQITAANEQYARVMMTGKIPPKPVLGKRGRPRKEPLKE